MSLKYLAMPELKEMKHEGLSLAKAEQLEHRNIKNSNDS